LSSDTGKHPFPRSHILAAVFFAAGVLACLRLAWLPLEASLSRFGFEDIFYYLRVARSLAEGQGPTLDGIHSTNGFHPLWMLVSVGLVAGFKAGSPLPVHLAFSLCALLHALTALVIYRMVLRSGHRWAALAAMFLWMFNYNVIALSMCGLETALFGFLLICALAFYLPRRETLSTTSCLIMGALLGLTALARFDGALLGLAFAADQLFLWLRGREPIHRLLEREAPMSFAAVLLVIPWLVWSRRVSGAFLPNSHRALKLWVGREASAQMNPLERLIDMAARYLPEAGNVYGIMPLWPLALLALAALLIAIFRKPLRVRLRIPVIVFVFYPLAHASYYAANFAPLNRYLYPAHLALFTGLFIAAGIILKERRERIVSLLSFAALLIVFLNMTLSGIASWREGRGSAGTHSLHWTMYTQAAPWLRENIPPDEKIGAFNAGIYSYFSGRTVVNLDGVINDSVIPALENRRLFSYLEEEGIRYVIDWEPMLEFSFTSYSGLDDYRSRFTVIKSFEQPWGPHAGQRLLVLRLNGNADAAE
jgi:hypothetical protein